MALHTERRTNEIFASRQNAGDYEGFDEISVSKTVPQDSYIQVPF